MTKKTLLLAAFLGFAASPVLAQPFEFVALGDMPYNLPGDYPKYERLIDTINTLKLPFSIHVGDIKSGSTPCNEEVMTKASGYFARFAGAVVYTPGDNEWTDCHRAAAGRFDPLERLAWVRAKHFTESKSLGQATIPLVRQPDVSDFKTTVENARWVHNNVLFATIHVVGSNNNFEIRPGAPEEFMARDKANVAWIEAAFAEAERLNAPAMVFGMQADMWANDVPKDPNQSGFTATIRALTQGSAKFGKPVLLVDGDTHLFQIDQPLVDSKKVPLMNVTRLMVPGAERVHAVRVTVDPASPQVFGYSLIYLPENQAKPQM